MTKQEVIDFRKDFEEAVKGIEVKYSIKITLGNIHYDSAHLSSTFDAITVDSSGNRIFNSEFEENLRKYLTQSNKTLQVPEKIFGSKVILDNGVVGTIIDFNLKSRNYPVNVETKNGQIWRTAASGIDKFE
ncbi:MAG: hypothetical protein LBF63_08655 [Treponema sp.]|jgi:hypothetical protein|nr:hypothetical protein [Treponema sp.]